MGLPVKLAHLPARMAAGGFILNSGLSKRNADEETAASMHGMASNAYPFLKGLAPKQFVRLLSAGEIALGSALLLPVVPTALAGLGLAGFAGGLVGMYLRTPGVHKPGSPVPTEQGVPLAKDFWLFGIGVGFVIEALADRRRR